MGKDISTHKASFSPAAFHIQRDGDAATISISGEWTDYDACPRWSDAQAECAGCTRIALKDDGILSWNTSLVTFAFNLIAHAKTGGCDCDWKSLPKGVAILLNLALAVPEKQFDKAGAKGPLLERVGKAASEDFQKVLSILDFVGMLSATLWLFLRRRSRTKWADIVFQFARSGPQALGIISLIGLLIGVILSFVGCIPLRMFGAEIYVATLVGIGSFRMMAATTVGTVMAGRTGAAFAAELGSMQVNEEVDSYIAMGINPFEVLILPRFIALSATVPLLCIYCDLMGILGGLFVGVFYSDISATTYLHHMYNTTRLSDFWVGIFTSWIFGILISCCGCYHGLHCGRNSTAVGQAATSAVVSSIVCMVLATAVITLGTVILKI